MSDPRPFRLAFCAALLLLTAVNAAPVPAQQSTAAQASSANALTVDIPVVVYDKKGNLVQNLSKDDFILQVDGHPRTIADFNSAPNTPLTLGLLVDTNASQSYALDDERTTSAAFFDDTLNTPADKAFLVQFARQTDLLQDTTGSRPKLHTALQQLSTPSGSESNASSAGSNTSDSSAHARQPATTLYDALFLSSDELMGKQHGRKVLVLFSDGIDSGSKESLASSIEAAQRADTVVYAIYVKGNEPAGRFKPRQGRQGGGGAPGGGYPGGYPGGGYPGGGYPGGYPGSGYPGSSPQPQSLPSTPDGRKILERMAEETGGRLFDVGRRQSFAEIYKQIADEQRAQYRLSYAPSGDTASDGYHRIDLYFSKTSPKDLSYQARDGYYAGN